MALSRCNSHSRPKSSPTAALACLGGWEVGWLVRRLYAQLPLRGRGDRITGDRSVAPAAVNLPALTHARTAFFMENEGTCPKGNGQRPIRFAIQELWAMGSPSGRSSWASGVQQAAHGSPLPPRPQRPHGGVETRSVQHKLSFRKRQEGSPCRHCPGPASSPHCGVRAASSVGTHRHRQLPSGRGSVALALAPDSASCPVSSLATVEAGVMSALRQAVRGSWGMTHGFESSQGFADQVCGFFGNLVLLET